ncbi:MAG: hypothetical protein HC887_07155 [Desulfobacteraceae bacterium]|nr:hypothetical protein [Desulfobacteraceae bacterium]
MLPLTSDALKANISNIDVEIDPKYQVIQRVMSEYYGLTEGIATFVKELSHPQKNLQFIVKEARGYSLNYFHLINAHPEGADAAQRFAEVFLCVLRNSQRADVRSEAADNLLVFIQKIIKESAANLPRFLPVLQRIFRLMHDLDESDFFLFVKSYYRFEKLQNRC